MASNQPESNPSTSKYAIECPPECPIDFFDYDGTEHSIPKAKFSDVISRNAEKIQWRNIVGQMTLLDLYDDQDSPAVKEAKKVIQTAQAVKEQVKEKVEPTAGPWASVAKCLYQSMQEVDVLLDVLRISKTKYLKPEQLAAFIPEDIPAETAQKVKAFNLVSRRKAFDEAKKLLEMFKANSKDTHFNTEKSQFFDELKRMRENWRIRKVNELIFGDLGYRIYGPKFQQAEMFDILWSPKLANQSGKGCMQIQVPKNLQRRTKLAVSIVKDDQENHDLIFSKDSFNAYDSNSMDVPWEDALEWAQESLICKDIFTQLIKEAVTESHICIVTDKTLIVCLSDGMLLKFGMHYFPFQAGDLPELGDPYLNVNLRELFVSDLVKPRYRPQRFVGAPLSQLQDALDLRGSQGVASDEIKTRTFPPIPLLARMIRRAEHYMLVDRVVEVLNMHMLTRDDPALTWRWLRTTPTYSVILGHLQNRPDSHGKMLFNIRIGSHDVVVTTKENMVIQCYRQSNLLAQAIHTLASNCQLYSTSNFARQFGWQVLHANSNAYNSEGVPSPTLYCCNQSSTKRLFIEFSADYRSPKVFIMTEPVLEDDQRALDEMDTEEFLKLFKIVNLNRVPGSNFMKKIEGILTMFRI
ncbi:unnamed protein product [Bursaphelenchus okinawaensis]|uniref:Mediator of RNA polymerase II transcription subunit 17 n=1 Tax=Bursaphelenchus okinawaensis TaxID=465554 RepID=A0A811L9M3_9BILA|nr:unnamed protein product [Bursaphelenchus okinawaensis]CAG9118902.1 unnamed protein product [Bursaphelenchus okinawaensis]